jgi:D-alanyl-D-alanine carboxypeptidase
MTTYDHYFNKIKPTVPTLQIQIESKRRHIVYQYSSHEENQSFHSASIGKVFCATLVMMAIEEGKISLNSKVYNLFEEGKLDHLFNYKSVDYQKEVTIEHLLGHTSGVNDYFEGKTFDHPKFMSTLVKQKDHIYTPDELLDFTKKYQKAVGKPGQKFLYSDTGYLLLGFILEKIYDKTYANLLKANIYEPLGLKNTALCFHDEKFTPHLLAPILFKGVDMHLANSLSCDYAGGGLQTTTNDLALFLKGLFSGKLINKQSLKLMMKPRNSFHGIMRYGLGMIEIEFSRIMPWMRNYPKLYGGLGSLSVHAFYDPKNDDVYIINLGSPSKMRKSFMILVKMAKWLNHFED